MLTQANFYQLMTATSGYYALTEDIDMSNIKDANGNAVTAWTPTGTFSGTFDGCGYKIENFKQEASNALFKTLGGTVKNVAITNPDGGESESLCIYRVSAHGNGNC